MDNRDEIIRTQLDVIGSLINNNIRRMSDDIWGAPSKPQEKKTQDTPSAADKPAQQTAAPKNDEEPLPPPEKIEDLKAELNELIGLEGVKREVNSLINMVTVHNLRRQNGLKTVDMSLHMVFSGNPGTGKSMIARMMARIYRSLGVLSKGQLVEVDRSGLVAGFVGQTALKTQGVIDKAIGGVLFIDEAYALTNHDSPNDFGQEAVEVILKNMEDHRDDLIVIVAGYTDLMGDFIHSNPGLESRFNKYFYFEDYNGDQLMEIFRSQCRRGGYTLDDETAQAAAEAFRLMYEQRDENFGNARDVRNIFETAIARQANRVAALENPSKEDLMALTLDDLDLKDDGVSEQSAAAELSGEIAAELEQELKD